MHTSQTTYYRVCVFIYAISRLLFQAYTILHRDYLTKSYAMSDISVDYASCLPGLGK
jgi:hypothetical protein